jgi:hypothetical protein
MGRPSKLTPEIQHAIVEALRRGNYLETAAAFSNISKNVLFHWLKKGHEQKRGKYRQFLNAIKQAESEADMRDVLNIETAATAGKWQASAWRLERKRWELWGKRDPDKHMVDYGRVIDLISRIIQVINQCVPEETTRLLIVQEIQQLQAGVKPIHAKENQGKSKKEKL